MRLVYILVCATMNVSTYITCISTASIIVTFTATQPLTTKSWTRSTFATTFSSTASICLIEKSIKISYYVETTYLIDGWRCKDNVKKYFKNVKYICIFDRIINLKAEVACRTFILLFINKILCSI